MTKERQYDFRMNYREIENLCEILNELALEHLVSPVTESTWERLEKLRKTAYQLEPIT